MNQEIREVSRQLLASEARNLHAIQKNAKAMMLKVIDRLDDYPEARERLQAHLSDKDAEMQRLERVLEGMGESQSGAKDTVMSAMGGLTGAMTAFLEDDVVKTSMATFGLASYEIAAYEGMIQLAQRAGRQEAVPLLQACLDAERAMADWLHAHMAPTLDRYLELRARKGAAAAH